MRERMISMVSGGGSTLEHIAKASYTKKLPVDIVGVIASSPHIEAVDRVKELGLDLSIVDPKTYRGDDGKIDRYGFGQALLEVFKKAEPTIIMQNGWLPYTPENAIEPYKDIFFNQHPGPLPETRAMQGVQPYAAMLYFTRETLINKGTEVTVHRVTDKWDDGKIVGRKHVPIFLKVDTPELLQKRGMLVEYALQEEVIMSIINGELVEEEHHSRFMNPGQEKILEKAREKARKDYSSKK